MRAADPRQASSSFRSKRYLPPSWREGISDFGPPAVILLLTGCSLLPAVEALGTFSRLSMPGGFALSGGRPLMVNMLALPWAYRFLALLPACFLATLFFLDQVRARTHGVHGQAQHVCTGA